MVDVIVNVPGGSNNHNYANVMLIIELARLHSINAVWAGWGHASEKPALPNALLSSYPPIQFIGPAGPPMRALGDKIGSTIITQNAGVPCIAWNGMHVVAECDRALGTLPDHALLEASVLREMEYDDVNMEEGGEDRGTRRRYRELWGSSKNDPYQPISGMADASNYYGKKR